MNATDVKEAAQELQREMKEGAWREKAGRMARDMQERVPGFNWIVAASAAVTVFFMGYWAGSSRRS